MGLDERDLNYLYGFQPIEMKWEAVDADPIEDLRRWATHIAEQYGTSRPKHFMSSTQKAEYEDAIIRMQVLTDELEYVSRWNLIFQYVIRRMLGQPRLRIFWPAAYQLRERARYRWFMWRHRKDPDWLY